jgi:hypothetical protein
MKHGPLLSDIPGRTDEIPTEVASGSYVVPADIVSALGEGNTIAGTRILEQMFSGQKFAIGGPVPGFSEPVPVIVAGGEYIIRPELVLEIGGGDMDRGHRLLDDWVKKTRKDLIKTLQNLPPPAKD